MKSFLHVSLERQNPKHERGFLGLKFIFGAEVMVKLGQHFLPQTVLPKRVTTASESSLDSDLCSSQSRLLMGPGQVYWISNETNEGLRDCSHEVLFTSWMEVSANFPISTSSFDIPPTAVDDMRLLAVTYMYMLLATSRFFVLVSLRCQKETGCRFLNTNRHTQENGCLNM